MVWKPKIVCTPKLPSKVPYNEILEKQDTHFVTKPSTYYTGTLSFQQEGPLLGESILSYIAALCQPSHHCEFTTWLDSLLCGRFVRGLASPGVQCHLLAEANLIFNKAIQLARTTEVASARAEELHCICLVATARREQN